MSWTDDPVQTLTDMMQSNSLTVFLYVNAVENQYSRKQQSITMTSGFVENVRQNFG